MHIVHVPVRTGTRLCGKVQELDGESIQTQFWVLYLPFLPLASYYVVEDVGGGARGIELSEFNPLSVLVTYGRTWLWVPVLLAGWAAVIAGQPSTSKYDSRPFGSDSTPWWIMCAVLAAATLCSFLVTGGLSRREQLRRQTLRKVTGLGAPARLLGPKLVTGTRAELLDRWTRQRSMTQWTKAIEDGEADPLLLALAEYHARPDLGNRVLDRLGSSS